MRLRESIGKTAVIAVIPMYAENLKVGTEQRILKEVEDGQFISVGAFDPVEYRKNTAKKP